MASLIDQGLRLSSSRWAAHGRNSQLRPRHLWLWTFPHLWARQEIYSRRRTKEAFSQFSPHSRNFSHGPHHHHSGKYSGNPLHHVSRIRTSRYGYKRSKTTGISLLFPPSSNYPYPVTRCHPTHSHRSRNLVRGDIRLTTLLYMWNGAQNNESKERTKDSNSPKDRLLFLYAVSADLEIDLQKRHAPSTAAKRCSA